MKKQYSQNFKFLRITQKTTVQEGFTIIEVVIVVALSALLLLGMMGIFDWQNKIYQLEQADIFATGSARVAMNNITPILAQGSAIVASRTINGTGYTTSASTMIIQVPAFDSSGNVIASTYDYVVFTSSGTNLHQIVDIAVGSDRKLNNKLLSDKIEAFALTYNNNDPTLASQVTVDITTRAYYKNDQSVSAHLVETVFLRNK